MERPNEIIDKLVEIDGAAEIADELKAFFDLTDEENGKKAQLFNEKVQKLTELEARNAELEGKYQKLLEKNAELVMSGGASNDGDEGAPQEEEEGENETEAPLRIDELKFERKE